MSGRPRIADLPDVLTAQDVVTYLPIGRNAIYELLKTQQIRNVRVGQKFMVPKEALKDFLGGHNE